MSHKSNFAVTGALVESFQLPVTDVTIQPAGTSLESDLSEAEE